MPHWLVFVFGIFGLSWQVGGQSSDKYDNYSLLRIFPQNDDEMHKVMRFDDPKGEIEILKRSRGMNDSLDVLVPNTRAHYMMGFIGNGSTWTVDKREHYGRSFEQPNRSPRRRVMRPSSFNIFGYNSYQQILEFCETIAKSHGDIVDLQYIGESYQGRKIPLVKISSNPAAGNPIILIDAGIHAREWVAPAMALYLIQRLSHDPEARLYDLNGIDWYILPMVNPDGYEYTRAGRDHRMWRKTRSKNGNCYGVDGNRNYGFKWAVSGVSKNPCDKETFAGPQPFSEPETRVVRDVMRQNAKRIKLYISLHAYGQYLVYPWGYTGSFLPREWKKLDSLARHVSDAVQRAGGQPFKVLSAGQWYPAAGGSDDYAFGAVGVPYSYTMELTDGHEFIFPESLLKKVLPQVYQGFREFGSRIRSEFGSRRRGHGYSRSNLGNDSTVETETEIASTTSTIE